MIVKLRKDWLSSSEYNPDLLLKLLFWLALLSAFLIVSFSAYGIYRSSVDDVLALAEEDAERIGTVMVQQQSSLLFSAGDTDISLSPAQLQIFDLQVRRFLHPFAIVKIKVFSLDGTTIYSTDKSIIGQQVEGNPRLTRALNGEIDSHQETKEKLTDLADEQLFNVDVVEAYLPIKNVSGEIAGCFELYLDVTRYRDDILNRVVSSTVILAVILAIVFSFSFWLVSKITLQLKILLRKLELMAMTDPLTGAFNRSAVINRAQQELARMQRRKQQTTGTSVGVIIIDLDHFKKVNDTYGHLAGDEILREMTRRVISCLREFDVFGRYGGEEFLVIIPDGDYDGTILAADRLRQVLSEKPFRFEQQDINVTASFGTTVCDDPEEELHIALQRADEALYQAKNEGRNRVIGRN